MAKIVRLGGNYEPFAGAAQGTERTVFGEETQSDTLTANHTATYSRGWRGAVPVSGVPTIQDFNALGFSLDQALAYLHQMGIAEWDAAQEYYAGSLCIHDGGLGPQVWMARGEVTGIEPSWAILFGGQCVNTWQPYGTITLPVDDGVGPVPYVLELTVDTVNGPFFSLQHAIQAVAWSFRRPQGIAASGAPSVIITLPTGYADASQHIIDGIDLSWVRIEHADDEMSCARSALTTLAGGVAYGWMCAINGGRAPLVDLIPYLDNTGSLTSTALFLAHGAGSTVAWQLDTPAGPPAMHANSTWGVYATAGARAEVTGTGAAYPLFNASHGLYTTDSGEIAVTRALEVASVAVTGGKVGTIALIATGTVAVSAAGELIVNGALTAAAVTASGGSYISATSITAVTTGITVGTQARVGCGSATLTDASAPIVVNTGGQFLCAGAVAAAGTKATKILATGPGSVVEILGTLTVDNFTTAGINCSAGAEVRIVGNVSALTPNAAASAGILASAGRVILGGTFSTEDCVDGINCANGGSVEITGAVSCVDHTGNAIRCDSGARVLLRSTATLESDNSSILCQGGTVRIAGTATVTSSATAGVSVLQGGSVDFLGSVTVTSSTSGLLADDGGRIVVSIDANLANTATGADHAIYALDGGRVTIGGTTTTGAATSHNIHCLRGEIRFGGTVTATAGSQYGLYCDGGIIAGATINAATSRPSTQIAVVNGGRIMRAGGTGAFTGADGGANISANGHINR